MDRFWTEVVGAARELLGEGHVVVGPIELASALPLTYGYANTRGLSAETIDLFVLHKGLYEQVDPQLMRRCLDLLTPCFANDVFIILARRGEPLAADHPPYPVPEIDTGMGQRP